MVTPDTILRWSALLVRMSTCAHERSGVRANAWSYGYTHRSTSGLHTHFEAHTPRCRTSVEPLHPCAHSQGADSLTVPGAPNIMADISPVAGRDRRGRFPRKVFNMARIRDVLHHVRESTFQHSTASMVKIHTRTPTDCFIERIRSHAHRRTASPSSSHDFLMTPVEQGRPPTVPSAVRRARRANA